MGLKEETLYEASKRVNRELRQQLTDTKSKLAEVTAERDEAIKNYKLAGFRVEHLDMQLSTIERDTAEKCAEIAHDEWRNNTSECCESACSEIEESIRKEFKI